jgi:hypothetical protein
MNSDDPTDPDHSGQNAGNAETHATFVELKEPALSTSDSAVGPSAAAGTSAERETVGPCSRNRGATS